MSMQSLYYELERELGIVEDDGYIPDPMEDDPPEDPWAEPDPLVSALLNEHWRVYNNQLAFDDAENQRPVWEFNCDNHAVIHETYLEIYGRYYYPKALSAWNIIHMDWH